MPKRRRLDDGQGVGACGGLLNVSEKTIRRWVADDKVSYVKLPSGGLRIPQAALLASLQGTHDLAAELAARDARNANVTEEEVGQALEDERA